MTEEDDVVVCGAGPTGLWVACELARAGRSVRIFDRKIRRSPHSRATILWPRILELAERIDLCEEIVATGHTFRDLTYYSEKRLAARIRLDSLPHTRYPYGVTIPQDRTEDLLTRRFEELGGRVEDGYELLDIREEPGRVHYTLKGPDGESVEGAAKFLVGADGSRSTVRELCGIGFDGISMPTRLIITDAELDDQRTSQETAYFFTSHGNAAIAPLGDGFFRVAASAPPELKEDEVPDARHFAEVLRTRVPGAQKLRGMRFSAVFTADVRTARTFRSGQRVFLAGDAAHVVHPAGGQGLNSCVQDAVNLAWRLITALRDSRLPALDSYGAERKSTMQKVGADTARLARIGLFEKRRDILLRDAAMRLGTVSGFFDRALAPKLAQFDIDYAPERGGQLGRRVPCTYEARESDGFLRIDRHRHTVALHPGESYSWSEWQQTVRQVREKWGERLAVVDLEGRPSYRLAKLLNGAPRGIVVRPDGHLHDLFDITDGRLDEKLSPLSS
ncbi:FAD-dependent monooxygenase [Streptomyces sp. NPDC048420]|uniref:FAD-dependent monooxygenase n=1 Tax=Streptomyces sp. NPDC048420 TaxID=3155755 RepID=UPI0034480DBB